MPSKNLTDLSKMLSYRHGHTCVLKCLLDEIETYMLVFQTDCCPTLSYITFSFSAKPDSGESFALALLCVYAKEI